MRSDAFLTGWMDSVLYSGYPIQWPTSAIVNVKQTLLQFTKRKEGGKDCEARGVLSVSTQRTARDVKFSEAMSSRHDRWRA